MSLRANEGENKFLQYIRKGVVTERFLSMQKQMHKNARILTAYHFDISESLRSCLSYCMKYLYIQVIKICFG